MKKRKKYPNQCGFWTVFLFSVSQFSLFPSFFSFFPKFFLGSSMFFIFSFSVVFSNLPFLFQFPSCFHFFFFSFSSFQVQPLFRIFLCLLPLVGAPSLPWRAPNIIFHNKNQCKMNQVWGNFSVFDLLSCAFCCCSISSIVHFPFFFIFSSFPF